MNQINLKAKKSLSKVKKTKDIITDKDKLNDLFRNTIIWNGKTLRDKGFAEIEGGTLEELYGIRLMGKVYNGEPRHLDPAKYCHLNGNLFCDDYQIGSVLDIKSQYQINFCGRSVGKTTVMSSLPAAHWGAWLPYFEQMVYDTKKPMGIRFILLGNSMETAKAMMEYIRNYLKNTPLTSDLIDPKNDSKLFLRLINGTEYIVRSNRNLRGLNPYQYYSMKYNRNISGRTIILVDEYAIVKDPNMLDESLTAYLNFSKGCLFIANTTPFGQDNHAFRQSQQKRFRSRTFPTAANKYVRNRENLKELKIMYKETGQEWIWNEEFCGVPSSNAGQSFPNSWIDKVTYDDLDTEKYGGLWDDDDIDKMAQEGKLNHRAYLLGGDPNKGKSGYTDSGNKRVTDDAALALLEEDHHGVLRLRYARLFTKETKGYPICSKVRSDFLDTKGYIDQVRWLYKKTRIRKGLLDINPGVGMVAALQTSKGEEIRNIDTFDTDNFKKCEAAILWLYTLGIEGRFKMPNDITLARMFRRFSTINKKTGVKKTDLVWAIIFAAWNLQKNVSSMESTPGVRASGSASRIVAPNLAQVAAYGRSTKRPMLVGGGRY